MTVHKCDFLFGFSVRKQTHTIATQSESVCMCTSETISTALSAFLETLLQIPLHGLFGYDSSWRVSEQLFQIFILQGAIIFHPPPLHLSLLLFIFPYLSHTHTQTYTHIRTLLQRM